MPTVKLRKRRVGAPDNEPTTRIQPEDIPNLFYSKMKHLLDKHGSGLSDVSTNTKTYLEGFGAGKNG